MNFILECARLIDVRPTKTGKRVKRNEREKTPYNTDYVIENKIRTILY